VVAAQRHFLRDGEVVLLRLLPIDDFDRFGDLAGLDLHRHAVVEQAVNLLVVVVEGAVGIASLGAKLVEGFGDLRRAVAALGEVGGQQALLDIAVVRAGGPIAEGAIAEFVAEQGNHPVLGGAFGLADGAHFNTSQ